MNPIHSALTRKTCMLICLLAFSLTAPAQLRTTRSGLPPSSAATAAASDIPCGGTVVLFEDFSSGLPAGWTVVDGDSLAPRPEMQLQAGWQSRADYRDTSNMLMVTPSWYTTPGQSDDWLISPQITLGGDPCLSWTAYSQDAAFPERYEVRISTTTPDTAAFLADSALVTVETEAGDPNVRAASLAGYANQDVYIAFRQTSDDKFVLALDDVLVSNVNALDIGVLAADYGNPSPGDTFSINITVANYGSQVVSSFDVSYTVDGGTAQLMSVDSISLDPNETVSFDHTTPFISDTLDKFYDLCVRTSAPNQATDMEPANDTLCLQMAVGSPVSAAAPLEGQARMDVWPVPFGEELNVALEMRGKHDLELLVTDLGGRVCLRKEARFAGRETLRIGTEGLRPGVYFLVLREGGRRLAVKQLIRH